MVELTLNDFVDHHNCRLGKWYEQGDGKQIFSSPPSFRHMEHPHSEVHNNTMRIFELLKDNPDQSEIF